MTAYIFHNWINAADSNTVLMPFGWLWDGDAAGGGATVKKSIRRYLRKVF